MRLTYSVEPAPLGTAGAVRHALPLFRSETVLLVNGDSYCDADLAAFRRSHAEEPSAFGMVLARVADASRYGRVEVAADGRVVRFAEKEPAGPPGWINAGIYLFPRALLEGLDPTRPASLERDLLPAWVAAGRVRGFRAEGRFIDIGTPQSYAAAEAFFHACGGVTPAEGRPCWTTWTFWCAGRGRPAASSPNGPRRSWAGTSSSSINGRTSPATATTPATPTAC